MRFRIHSLTIVTLRYTYGKEEYLFSPFKGKNCQATILQNQRLVKITISRLKIDGHK
jgi:hypothetical protein